MTAFRIRMGNKTVAKCDGPNARTEIHHYAEQFRAEGEVTIQHNAWNERRGWPWTRPRSVWRGLFPTTWPSASPPQFEP